MRNILTFRVGDSLFGVDTATVEWIVDVERVFETALMPHYVLGEIEHAGKLYFLLSLKRILGLKEENDPENSSALILNVKGKRFALLVDEVLFIKEIKEEDYSSDSFSFYSEDNEVIEIIKEEFFAFLGEIPTLRSEEEDFRIERGENTKRSERDLLLFKLGERLFAVEVDLLNFVEVKEDAKKGAFVEQEEIVEGIFLIKNRIMKVINLKRLFKIGTVQGENIFVFKEGNRYVALSVDEIYNVENVDEEEINESVESENIKEFFVKDDEIVSIISKDLVMELLRKYGMISKKRDHSDRNEEGREFLIVRSGDSEFAIFMDRISGAYEMEDIVLSKTLAKRNGIEGIASIGSKSYMLLNLAEIIGKKDTANDHTVLIVGSKNDRIALKVAEIDDILHVPNSKIFITDQNSFIKGSIVYKEKVYNLVNGGWLVDYIRQGE